MALASLCCETSESLGLKISFTGFIVDHRLRAGSSLEAIRVANELENLGVKPKILTIDWAQYGNPATLSNFESLARKLRYRALGTACAAARIPKLLVGHHSDDQVETVVQRLLGGYTGAGLRGIKPEIQIPECAGMYGVSESGTPRPSPYSRSTREVSSSMRIESGGVSIARPLLTYPKSVLVRHCQEKGVTWFEDETNKDSTLTVRNTIRYLLEEDALPVALQRNNLIDIAHEEQERQRTHETQALAAFNNLPIKLNLGVRTVTCGLPDSELCTSQVGLLLIRKVLNLVSPVQNIQLASLCALEDIFYPEQAATAGSRTAQLAGSTITLRRSTGGASELSIERIPPYKLELESATIKMSFRRHGLGFMASSWRLWDNRYWIRVWRSGEWESNSPAVSVRFLRPDDVSSMLQDETNRGPLRSVLRSVPGKSRLAIPVIEAASSSDRPGLVKDDVMLTLPSLGWNALGWKRWSGEKEAVDSPNQWYWDIRYKRVDFEESPIHKIDRRLATDVRERKTWERIAHRKARNEARGDLRIEQRD